MPGPKTHVARRAAAGHALLRMFSSFAHGILMIVGRLKRGDSLVLSRLVPEVWPGQEEQRQAPLEAAG